MDEWLADVPESILKELNQYGLTVGCKLGGSPPVRIDTSWFEVKGRKDVISGLEALGWEKDSGRVRNGKKYIRMSKSC